MRRLVICATLLVLCGCAQDRANGLFGHDHLWMGLDADTGDLVLDKTIGDNRLLVRTIGGVEQIHEIRRDCIKGGGLNVHIFHGDPPREVFACTWGEIEGDVILDYSQASSGIFLLTDCVVDPRQSGEEWSPFIETRVTILPDGSCQESERLVLAPEQGDIGMWANAFLLWADNPDHASDREDPLGHLLNIAVDRPDEVLRALHDLFRKTDSVGAGESLKICIGNVERIKELREP